RVQAVCVVLLLLILGLLCSCLWRHASHTCHKAPKSPQQRRTPEPGEPEGEPEFDAVPSGLSKSEASTPGCLGAEESQAQARAQLAESERELPKMASRYSIKSAFSRWTRAKAKVRVVWKLNLLQVQNWLNGKGEAPQLEKEELQVAAAAGQDLEAGDADEDLQSGDADGEQVPQERGSLDDPMPPRASAAVGFLGPQQRPEALPEALPAYADGDRVEYFSPTCGLWLLGEVTVKSDAKRKVSYAVTLKGRWRAQERPHVPLELLRAPLQVGEPVELWSRGDWRLAEVQGLEASTALLRHYKVRVFGQESVAVVEASYLRRRFLKGSAVEVYRGPARGWICTRVSDMASGPGFTNFASSLDAVTDGFPQADAEHPEPCAELWEPQSGGPDSRRGAPPRKSDGSRFQPCDFVARVPVLKEFAVSDEDVEEVPSFLLRPAASSPSCPSQVFQI
ncbi:unnamed protein product, partial [Symbiodinium microadriaticum]